MSRRACLTSKRRRTEPFRFEVADPTVAERALAHATVAARRAAGEALAAAEQAVELAQAALDACYDTVLLRAMSLTLQQQFQHEQAAVDVAADQVRLVWTAEVERATAAGEPAPVEPAVPATSWAAESLEVRLIAACDADGHTAQEWAQAFNDDDPDSPSDWTLQDRADLLEACYRVNSRRGYDLALLGKG